MLIQGFESINAMIPEGFITIFRQAKSSVLFGLG